MFTNIGDRVPRGTECRSKIRSTIWCITIKSDIVFLAEIQKIIFMPIRMKFNLKRKIVFDELIPSSEHT
jgi:hypothetical protein